MNCKNNAIEILKRIVSDAEDHQLFLGWDLSEDEICKEGGDAAFITYDVAYAAKAALKELNNCA